MQLEGNVGLDRLTLWDGHAVHVAGGVLVSPAGNAGLALFARRLEAQDGIYRIALDAEVAPDADPATWPDFDVFDSMADSRIYTSHRFGAPFELFFRVYATRTLEVRIFPRGAAYRVRSLACAPVLLDGEAADVERLCALGARLQSAGGEAAAIYRVVDRLDARGAHAPAAALARSYLARVEGPAAWTNAALRRVHAPARARGLEANGFERPSDAAIGNYVWSRRVTTFDLYGLNPDARDELAARGYATEFLQATRLFRQADEPGRSWREREIVADPPESDPPRQPLFERHPDIDRSYQTSIARGDGMIAHDPVDGVLRRSHHGFLITFCDLPFVFYRFEGVEVFYVCTGHISSPRTLIYLPASETIVLIGDPWYRNYQAVDLVKRLNTDLVRHVDLVMDYLAASTRPAAVVGSNIHGHFFWNDLSGLDYAVEAGLTGGLAEIIRVDRQFADPAMVFPELAALPAPYFKEADAALRHAMTARLLPVHFTDIAMRPSLIQRLRLAAERAAPGAGPAADAPRPLIWINLRRHNKVWTDQAQGYASLLNALHARYGAASAYVDGMADCRPIFEEIRALTDPEIALHDGLHPDTLITLQWAWRVDAYVAVIGSSLMMVNAMADRRGVAHSEHGHLEQMDWWPTVRPGLTPPLVPDRSQVSEIGEGLYTDYLVDWRVLLDLLRRVLAEVCAPASRDGDSGFAGSSRFFGADSAEFIVHSPTRLEGSTARAPAGAVDQVVTAMFRTLPPGVHSVTAIARALGGSDQRLAWRVLRDREEVRFSIFHDNAVTVVATDVGTRLEVQFLGYGAEAIIEGVEVRPMLLDNDLFTARDVWDAVDRASALGASDEVIAHLRTRLARVS